MKCAVSENDDRRTADKPGSVTAADLAVFKANLAKQLHGLNIIRGQRHSGILARGWTGAKLDQHASALCHFMTLKFYNHVIL